MRAGDDLPREELARLFEEYFFEGDGRFARAVFGGDTQIGRSLVREAALPERLRRSRSSTGSGRAGSSRGPGRSPSLSARAGTTRSTSAGLRRAAAGLPQLRHLRRALARSGHAERIDAVEGLRILAECQAAGLAQTADNVQRERRLHLQLLRLLLRDDARHPALRPAARDRQLELDRRGRRRAVQRVRPLREGVPDEALWPMPRRPAGKKRRPSPARRRPLPRLRRLHGGLQARRDRDDAAPAEVFTPETTFERVVAMAIERGKLVDLVLEDPERLGGRAIGLVLKALEAAPPVRAALAIRPLRSAFLNAFLPAARLLARASSDALS